MRRGGAHSHIKLQDIRYKIYVFGPSGHSRTLPNLPHPPDRVPELFLDPLPEPTLSSSNLQSPWLLGSCDDGTIWPAAPQHWDGQSGRAPWRARE
mgnify:CR=1 FL=1